MHALTASPARRRITPALLLVALEDARRHAAHARTTLVRAIAQALAAAGREPTFTPVRRLASPVDR